MSPSFLGAAIFSAVFLKGAVPAALLAINLSSCAERPPETPHLPAEKVRIVRVKKETIRPVLKTFGTIVHRGKADVYAPFEGVVERVDAEEGDRVSEGRILAVMAKDKLLLSRDQALAAEESKKALLALAEERLVEGRKSVEAKILAAAKARSEAERKKVVFENLAKVHDHKKKLFAVGGLSEGELDNVKTQYLAARTDLGQAETDLEIMLIGLRDRDIEEAGFRIPEDEDVRRRLLVELNTGTLRAERNVAAAEREAAAAERRRLDLLLCEADISSPLSGVVASRGIERGERTTPETPLFSILETGSVYARVDVGEKDLASVRVGQDAEVFAAGLSPRRGTVKLVSPHIDPRTKSAQARILLDNSGGGLIPGMYVRLNIGIGEARSLPTVPVSALVEEEDGGTSVLALRGGTLFKLPVTLADRADGRAAVSSGLEEGERIVERPQKSHRDGMRAEAAE